MDQNGILFFYPGALYVAGTRMQIHGLPQFPANDSTFAGGTTMEIHGMPEARANDSTQSVKACHWYHCPGSCKGARRSV